MVSQVFTKISIGIISAVSVLVLSYSITHPAYAAATLSLQPTSGRYQLNQTFTTTVVVATGNDSINAVQGTVAFPAPVLEVTSVSKANSVVNLWVQEPTFSNTNGTISFEGIVLNPGYTGERGTVLTITFRVKANGLAAVQFSGGSVLANDGNGTNILGSFSDATYNGETSPSQPTKPIEPPKPTPKPSNAPAITSSTHPNQSRWYNNNNPSFKWTLPKDVSGVALALDQKAGTNPGTKSLGRISSKVYKKVKDGIWYLHVRFKYPKEWGGVSHYAFRIDTQKPTKLEVKQVSPAIDNPEALSLQLMAVDETSGIDRYEITLGDQTPITWQDDGTGIFTVFDTLDPDLPIKVKVLDKAGNVRETSIIHTHSDLEPPTLTSFPQSIPENSLLHIAGLSYPESKVTLWIQSAQAAEPESIEIKTNEAGEFKTIYQNLDEGEYFIWAEVAVAEGERSRPSDKASIQVTEAEFTTPPQLQKTLTSLDKSDIILVFISSLTSILLLFVLYNMRMLRTLRQAFSTRGATGSLAEHILLLELTAKHRRLTDQEQILLETLRDTAKDKKNKKRAS